jgi:hypothetical protein
MKRLLVCTGLLIAATALFAQQTPPKSPPATESATIGGKTITIAYSSPRVKGREGHIFTKDGLIGHDPQISGVARRRQCRHQAAYRCRSHHRAAWPFPKGDYTLFVDISDPDSWVLIVNKQTGQWGLSHDPAQDLGSGEDEDEQTYGHGREPEIHPHRPWRRHRQAHPGMGEPLGIGSYRRALRPAQKRGCPTLAAFLLLRLEWDAGRPSFSRLLGKGGMPLCSRHLRPADTIGIVDDHLGRGERLCRCMPIAVPSAATALRRYRTSQLRAGACVPRVPGRAGASADRAAPALQGRRLVRERLRGQEQCASLRLRFRNPGLPLRVRTRKGHRQPQAETKAPAPPAPSEGARPQQPR